MGDTLSTGEVWTLNGARSLLLWVCVSVGEKKLGRAHVKGSKDVWNMLQDMVPGGGEKRAPISPTV